MIKKEIHKIKPQRVKSAHNEIFVQNKAHISRYERRIHELFDQGHSVILIHGLQASILKCIRIALNICDFYSDVKYTVKTSSQQVEQFVDGQLEHKLRSGVHLQLTKHSKL